MSYLRVPNPALLGEVQSAPQTEMDLAMTQVMELQRRELAATMQQIMASLMTEMQEAGSRVAMTNMGIAVGLQSLPVANWVGQAVMGLVSGIQGQYAEEAKEILESARIEALALQSASEDRIDVKINAAVRSEQPAAMQEALIRLGIPVVPDQLGHLGFSFSSAIKSIGSVFQDVIDGVRDIGRAIDKNITQPVAHSIRSYVGGRVVKEEAIEEKNRLLNEVRTKLNQHEKQIDELVVSAEFRSKLRSTMIGYIMGNPQIQAIVADARKKQAAVKRGQMVSAIKSSAAPVAIGAGVGILLLALLK